MPCKARLSCHLVTFQQDSNFILLLFVYLVQRETRWHASCSKPLYGNGLKIAKTIKAKWRGKWWTSWSASHSSSVFKLSVLSVLSMGHLCERGPFYLQLQKLSINTKLGGGWPWAVTGSEIREVSNSPTTNISPGESKNPNGEREGGETRGRGKEVKQRRDSSSWGPERWPTIYIRDENRMWSYSSFSLTETVQKLCPQCAMEKWTCSPPVAWSSTSSFIKAATLSFPSFLALQ